MPYPQEDSGEKAATPATFLTGERDAETPPPTGSRRINWAAGT